MSHGNKSYSRAKAQSLRFTLDCMIIHQNVRRYVFIKFDEENLTNTI